jgi:UDP-4-amino-4-deoxy-L-arabinose formyltransferase / UDP-glucuronic acid dehydrogenase (UDP-4-keto-hexauronic acid decarboxylating)
MKYRGCSPANWAILNGETETGVTLHRMTVRPDAGDIVCQHRVEIAPTDDACSLNRKLAVAARPLLDECLPLILAGKAPRIRQNESTASYFGRRKPADGEIDWSRSATEIANLVRAVSRPYPGAFTHAHGKRILIWKAEARSEIGSRKPAGTVISASAGWTFSTTISCRQSSPKS